MTPRLRPIILSSVWETESEQHKAKPTTRTVPAFSLQANQKNTVTTRPKPVPRKTVSAPDSPFVMAFDRADFPLTAYYGSASERRIRWLVPLESISYDVYLPTMAHGLRDRLRPYAVSATYGLWDMLARDDKDGRRVMSALPCTVKPLRLALDAGGRHGYWEATVRALKSLQKLAVLGRCGSVGRALVPFYQRLLFPVNAYLYHSRHVYATDGLNLGTRYNVADLCDEVLSTLERTGGRSAYKPLKYAVPMYDRRKPMFANTHTDSRLLRTGNVITSTLKDAAADVLNKQLAYDNCPSERVIRLHNLGPKPSTKVQRRTIIGKKILTIHPRPR